MIGVYAGSFDPCTNGHIDIIKRAVKIVNKLYVVVSINKSKKCLFSLKERMVLIEKTLENMDNIEICYSDTLLISFLEKINANVIIRGVRNSIDFSKELEMTLNNNKLNNEIETIYLPAKLDNIYISSSYVKEIASYGGNVSHMVSKYVNNALLEKINTSKNFI